MRHPIDDPYVRGSDPCRCDHDFIEHDTSPKLDEHRHIHHTQLPNSCTVCKCDEYIPIPYSDAFLRQARALR